MNFSQSNSRQAGVALISALWLTLILGAIAFGVAAEVRSSADLVTNNLALSQVSYYAEGGIHAAVAEILSRRVNPNVPPPDALDQYREGQRWMVFRYREGAALVEVVPENAKLSANYITAEQAASLLSSLSVETPSDPDAGVALADWRSPRLSTVDSAYDAFYANASPPYQAGHTALKHLEELIAIKGFSSELFYGPVASVSSADEALPPALLDLMTSESLPMQVNINFAKSQLLATLPGWDLAMAREVAAARRDDALQTEPFLSLDDLTRRVPAVASVVGLSPITLNSGDLFTLTATGLSRGSNLVHTTRCLVRIHLGYPAGYKVIGWWQEWPWSQPPAGVLGSVKEML